MLCNVRTAAWLPWLSLLLRACACILMNGGTGGIRTERVCTGGERGGWRWEWLQRKVEKEGTRVEKGGAGKQLRGEELPWVLLVLGGLEGTGGGRVAARRTQHAAGVCEARARVGWLWVTPHM